MPSFAARRAACIGEQKNRKTNPIRLLLATRNSKNKPNQSNQICKEWEARRENRRTAQSGAIAVSRKVGGIGESRRDRTFARKLDGKHTRRPKKAAVAAT
jgi:hypothetical protein